MKKIALGGLISILLLSCYFIFNDKNELNESDVKNNIEDKTTNEEQKDTIVINTTADMEVDYSNMSELKSSANYIALVKIDKVIGADNYSTINKMYVFPYTYGKMTIIKSYKGNIEENKEVTFYKLGGTIELKKYYESLNVTQKEKFDANYIKNKTQDFKVKKVQMNLGKEVNVEENKTYLVFMNEETSYHKEKDSYAIVGLEYGIREVKSINNDNLLAKNNVTGEYETLRLTK